jgi:hypothetical protein
LTAVSGTIVAMPSVPAGRQESIVLSTCDNDSWIMRIDGDRWFYLLPFRGVAGGCEVDVWTRE